MIIDIISCIINSAVVTWLYCVLFRYNVNNFSLTNKENKQQIICLGLPLFVVSLLIYQKILKRNSQYMKYILGLRGTIPSGKIHYKIMIIEILFHLFQPIPFFEKHWYVNLTGNTIILSLDIFLFFLSIFRLYVWIKVYLKWNPYTNSRAKIVLYFFSKQYHQLYDYWKLLIFAYKTNIKIIPLIISFVFFGIYVLIFGLLLNIFEAFQMNNNRLIFNRFANNIWFLMQTISQVGYGDINPSTLTGKMTGCFICLCGITFQSLFALCLLVNVSVFDDNEIKAFQEINVFYTKEIGNNKYNNYFNVYLKHKFRKIKTKIKEKDILTIIENEIQHNKYNLLREIKKLDKYKILRENNLVSVLSSTHIPDNLHEFCQFVSKDWEPEANYCTMWYRERINISKLFFDTLSSRVLNSRNFVVDLSYKNNQMVNLVMMMLWVGKLYYINNYQVITKHKIIEKKEFDMKFKEFCVFYEDHFSEDICNSPTYKDRMKSGVFPYPVGPKVSSEMVQRTDSFLGDESFCEYDSSSEENENEDIGDF